MQVRVFTLHFDPAVGGFDDKSLREFVKDREVLSIRDHFFTREETPYLALVVTYNALRPEQNEKTPTEKREEDRDKWRAILKEDDWPLFNALRDWRNDLAKEEGVPPYVICTNRQLAEIAHRRPESLAKLAAIEGMGKAKLDRYGSALLEVARPVAEEGTEEGGDG